MGEHAGDQEVNLIVLERCPSQAEGATLLMSCGRKATVGSNPTLSAEVCRRVE
jgi:hypothetical protein